jgi:hypothetical protein
VWSRRRRPVAVGKLERGRGGGGQLVTEVEVEEDLEVEDDGR